MQHILYGWAAVMWDACGAMLKKAGMHQNISTDQ
jgi:hypothetical protein